MIVLNVPLEVVRRRIFPVAEATMKATVVPFASQKDIELIPLHRNLRLLLVSSHVTSFQDREVRFAYRAIIFEFLQDVTPVDEKRVRKKEEKGRKRKK
jgi:hypothetical protein